jgi:hypothetical protein
LRSTPLLPSSDERLEALFDALLIEAALARIAAAFTEDPDRLGRALAGLADQLESRGGEA